MQDETHIQRRNVLTATGTVALLGVGGAAGLASGKAASTVASAPVPDSPNAHTYPTMGADDGAPTATVYGNFKCPYTKKFVGGNLQAIIDEFVDTGRLNLQFYNLAYQPGSKSAHFISGSDPRCAAMGIGIWEEDPESYWQFFAETFDDPPEGYVDPGELASRARSAGVSNADEIVGRVQAGEYDAAVEQVSTEAAADGVTYTPTLELAGDTTSPRHGTQATLDWIETRLDDESAGTDTANSGETDDSSAGESARQDSEDATASEEQASRANEEPSETSKRTPDTDRNVIDTERKTVDDSDTDSAIWDKDGKGDSPWGANDFKKSDDDC